MSRLKWVCPSPQNRLTRPTHPLITKQPINYENAGMPMGWLAADGRVQRRANLSLNGCVTDYHWIPAAFYVHQPFIGFLVVTPYSYMCLVRTLQPLVYANSNFLLDPNPDEESPKGRKSDSGSGSRARIIITLPSPSP